MRELIAKIGVGRGNYFDLVRGHGNPMLRTIERVAGRLDQSLFELVGLTDAELRRATKRVGIDYDELKAALAERKTADSRITTTMTLRKRSDPAPAPGTHQCDPLALYGTMTKRVRLQAGAAKAARTDISRNSNDKSRDTQAR